LANYGVFGYVKTPDGTIVKNAKVYPYFKKISAAAPASKWADNPYTTSTLGYYSFNLGDLGIIGTESNIVKGTDKIYLAIVWNETNVNDQDKNSLTFTHCSFIEHTIINEDFIEINITLEPKRLPILDSIIFSNTDLKTRTNYIISEKSHADYTWKSLAPYSGTPVSQKLTFDLVPIFDGHQMIETIYDWGETIFNKTNSTSSSYMYDKAGIYNTCVTVREKWNTEVKTCQQVTVKYNKPIVNFNWSPTLTNSWEGSKIKGNELITFTNLSSDIDNRTKDSAKWGLETYYYKWTIEDKNLDGSNNTKIYSNTNFNYKPQHQFQSPGTKNITLEIFWNDGFNDYIETITKQIIISEFNIIPNFNWNKVPRHRNDEVTFSNISTGDTFQIVKYNWFIEDNYPNSTTDLRTFKNDEISIFNEGSVNPSLRIQNDYTFDETTGSVKIKFHSTEVKTIKLIVTYFNGWENKTKEISKDLIPVKYSTEPNFSISNINPKGRHELVTFNNTTNYSFDGYNLAYTVDWRISDFYSALNLDNPNYGTITDNSEEFLNVIYSIEQSHYYQNIETNNIELTIRYDDGWQEVTKRIVKTVNPIVYDGIIPDFEFNIPESRFDEVFIDNTTTDTNNRFRKMEYFLTDKFNKFNPDNPNYKVSSTLNNKSFELFDKNEIISHFYQDSSNENIELIYYYDDGFEEQFVSKTRTITKIINDIIPAFESNITPINNGFIGKQEIVFTNTSIEVYPIKIEDERWVFNDVVFGTDSDNITERNDQIAFDGQSFTFQTPSRMPFSSKEFLNLGLPKVQNINKSVLMELRIDNGWRNDTELGNYLDPDNNICKVYFEIEKFYEATPNELDSNISYVTNINNYKH